MESKKKKIVGNNLKQARENAKMTQLEVANKAEINVNYYARIERGEKEPSIDTLNKLAKVLKIKVSDVITF
jgi:transcriptional regulator with XRE-family HTH domain